MNSDERDEMGPPPAAAVDAMRTVVGATLEAIDLEGEISIEDGEDEVVVRVTTEHSDPLIGRNGATIDALQYVVSQSAQRAGDGWRRRIVVDVNDYRRRRVDALEALAKRAAEEAVSHEEEIELDPMNPAERRIIHMALKDDPSVETRSEGEEPRRCVVVVPAGDAD